MRGVKKRTKVDEPKTSLGIVCLPSGSSFDRACGIAACGHSLFGEAVGYPARRLAAVGEHVERLAACLTCVQFAANLESDETTVRVTT